MDIVGARWGTSTAEAVLKIRARSEFRSQQANIQ
jgi:hypothetical protein